MALLSRFFWWLLRSSPAGGGRAGGVLAVWLLYDRLYRALVVRPVTIRNGGMFEVERARRRGVPVLVLHLDNARLARAVLDPHRVIAEMRADVAALARRPDLIGDATALTGVSLFAAAARRLGFEVRPLPCTLANRILRYFLVGIAAIYHAEGWRGITKPERLWPGEVWMPIERLGYSGRRLVQQR